MSTHLLLETAVRTLVMGAIVFIALGLLRIEQVRARRTAWLLALAGALAMPFLVAAQIGPRLLPDFSSFGQASVASIPQMLPGGGESRAPAAAPQGGAANSRWIDHSSPSSAMVSVEAGGSYGAATPSTPDSSMAESSVGASSAGASSMAASSKVRSSTTAPSGAVRFRNAAWALAVASYCAVTFILLLRLFTGIGFAIRLRNQAERVSFPFDPELDARASERLASPATIGSSVLLPKNYKVWDGATLRIVLTHERAHVRQKDFYVHALAGLHCALFWFNPFSWWLQRQLSELGEALSDCAAVEEADSRASYAETLLAFATRSSWPETYVAMANSSNLTPRIERLLNDQGFERSFAPKQRLPFVAAGVVLLALVASTSMVRVNAAQANGPLNANTVVALNEANVANDANTATSNTATESAPQSSATPADTGTPGVPATPTVKKKIKVRKIVVDSDTHDVNADFDAEEVARASEDAARASEDAALEEADRAAEEADRAEEEAARATHDAMDQDVMAIRSGDSHIMFNMSDRFDLRSQPSGDYIYFQHDGKPYLIQDPKIIAKAHELLAPMKELSQKQKELGFKQHDLGLQQRDLAKQNHTIRLAESPDFKRQMEELQKRLKEMDLPRLTAQIDQKTLAEVQAHLGQIQAQVGHLQAEFGMHNREFGEEMGKLGREQGRLGREQGQLGREQRKIVEDAKRQLRPMIEQAIRDGVVTPMAH